MPLHEDNNKPIPGRSGPALAGGSWALVLAAVLLAAFAGMNILRRLPSHSPATLETVVQLPVSADNAPSDDRATATAPDPGDNP